MIDLLRRLWHAWRHPEMIKLPPRNPVEEAYDIRGPAKRLLLSAEGKMVDQTYTQLDMANEFARFVLAVDRSMKGATPLAVADKAVRVWHGLEDLE